MDANELIQQYRERRLTTLALGDQIAEDRWREPAISGGRSIHDLLAHIIAWDEWAAAVFDLSRVRDALPAILPDALRDPDAYNARHVARMQNLTRDDLLAALQEANPRVLKSAITGSGADWHLRRIADLAGVGVLAPPAGQAPRAPMVGTILRVLMAHEAMHNQEVMEAFGIQPNLERLRNPEDGGISQGAS
jgi:hypothetical protein